MGGSMTLSTIEQGLKQRMIEHIQEIVLLTEKYNLQLTEEDALKSYIAVANDLLKDMQKVDNIDMDNDRYDMDPIELSETAEMLDRLV